MKITELLHTKMTLSFEVFPPKDEVPMDGLLETLSHLYLLQPDFISCTYGAGGSKRGKNMEVCGAVKKTGHTVMPHLTCIGNVRDDIKQFVSEYIDLGIENILALRGDFPAGWEGTKGDFAYAGDLIGFIRAEFPGLCIGAAAYPEKHLTALSMESDIGYLRSKQDKGAAFIMTQLCHDVPAFERFVEQIRKAGITIPIIAGIMPVLVREPVIRMTLFNGCSIPAELAAIMGKYEKDPPSFTKAGIEYTVAQIHRYMAAGIDGLHLYTLNKWEKITEIVRAAGIDNGIQRKEAATA
ncbi:MAG: methylenetetrahydrofolate reductase [Treponema sp.]|jgi:methylenetetrahydrofolate reductase (NADPH)|nr:methylenetetrahydrofolate reductase [Treponema sp.]